MRQRPSNTHALEKLSKVKIRPEWIFSEARHAHAVRRVLGPHWGHPPQDIFIAIRAGKREEVLTSESMWMHTSELPITHVMHGLARYAHRLGIASKQNPTGRFA